MTGNTKIGEDQNDPDAKPGPLVAKSSAAGGQAPADIQILIACMPKSGSTLLSRSVQSVPGFRRVSVVPGYERREQELCPRELLNARDQTDELRQIWQNRNLRYSLRFWRTNRVKLRQRPFGYVCQHHVRYSETTAKLIREFNLKPVFLVRNIFDVVLSVRDHYRNLSPNMSMAYVTPEISELPDDELHDFIVDMVLPWYFNFYVSWQGCDDKLLVSYNELISDKPATLARVLKFAGIHEKFTERVSSNSIQAAEQKFTRKNIGKSGRGRDLSEHTRARIHRMAAYYPGIDFSPIGL